MGNPIAIALPIAEAVGEGGSALGLGSALASNPIGWGTAIGLGASALWNAAGLPSPTKAIYDWATTPSTPTKSQIQTKPLTDADRAQMAQKQKELEIRKSLVEAGASPELLSILYGNMMTEAATAEGTATPPVSNPPATNPPAAAPSNPAPATNPPANPASAQPANPTANPSAEGTANPAPAAEQKKKGRIGRIVDAAKGAVKGAKEGYSSNSGSSEGGDDDKKDKKTIGQRAKSLAKKVAVADVALETAANINEHGFKVGDWTWQLPKIIGQGASTVRGTAPKPVEPNDATTNVQQRVDSLQVQNVGGGTKKITLGTK